MIRKKNSRLTYKERIQIEVLLNENKEIMDIFEGQNLLEFTE